MSGCAWRQGVSAGAAAAPITVGAYRVELTPSFEEHSVAGSTTLHLTVGGAGVVRFPVEGIVVDGVATGAVALPFTHRDGVLTIVLDGRAAPRDIDLTVRYHGPAARSLVWGERSVHTNFFSCGWVICDEDRPGDRARLVLDLIVPEDLDVVASGEEVATRPAGPGLVRRTWQQDRPYPTYLFGFAIGRFQRVTLPSAPPGLEVVAEGTPPERLAAMFRDTETMRTFFEERAGVPLPHRYTQVLVGGAEAQEKSSFSLLGREHVEPLLTTPTEDWAIAHELAHQWWGNLVTCGSWQDFWLNEGVTVFVVAAYKERRWGRAEYDRELERARTRWQHAIDAGFDVPLAYPGPFPTLRIRRAITYSKGALFLDLLRRTLGEQAFWEGLRAYTRASVGKSVESRDLQRAMEASSGRDLSALFREWVYGS